MNAPRHRTRPTRLAAPRARGLVLIDVLISVLVFSLGVLAVVSLQSVAAQQSSQAQYRAEATLLANALISQMWVADRDPAALANTYATGKTSFNTWSEQVTSRLPGASSHTPTVVVDQIDGATGQPKTARVTVTVRWKLPAAPAEDPANQLVMVAQIR